MSLRIQTNVCLQSLNTMAVPACADYFAEIKSIDDAVEAVKFAKAKTLEIFVLGDGSNTLFTEDYSGLILRNCLLGIELLEEDEETVLLRVAAGENWHRFVAHTIQQGWYGLENLALIPGLVGAAPIQNIGAYGVEVKDCITAVECLEFESQTLMALDNSQCEFAYRDSVFKQSLRGKRLISAVLFRLNKQASVNLSYSPLANQFDGQNSVTPKQVFDAVVKIRQSKLPSPDDIPNLGSFFKNPIIDSATHERLKNEHPDLVSYPLQGDYKLAAAWLIESAGWKHKTIGDVSVHQKQALVIVNPHQVSGRHILNFAREIRADILKKFGVQLEIEPKLLE